MSSTLVITRDQFPGIIPDDAKVGDEVVLTVCGTIRRIEADLVDTTGLGERRQNMLGPVETEVAITFTSLGRILP